MNLITRIKEDFIVYREKLRRKFSEMNNPPESDKLSIYKKNLRTRRIIIVISFAVLAILIIYGLIFGITRLVERNTNVSDAINAVVMSDGQQLSGSFFYSHELEKGANVYILDSFIENGEIMYKVKYDNHVGTISSKNIKYFSSDTTSEYALMSDVSHFLTNNYFETENDFEVFLLENDFQYVYIRAGGRGYGADGNFYFDKKYQQFIDACEYLKIPYGFYFLDEALDENEADEEIKWIKDFLNKNSTSYNVLPIAIDIEYFDGKGRGDDKWEERKFIIEYLCQKLDEENIENIIYTNANRASQYFSEIDNEFWLAYYPSINEIPNVWLTEMTTLEAANNIDLMNKTIGWQFTETGVSGSGINIKVDVNIIKNEFFSRFINKK